METIEPQLLRRRRLGGAADKHRKVLDTADVVLLRLLSKMTGSHIVDHALTKRADRHTQLLLRMRLTPHSQSELSARLDGSEGKLRATQQPTARAVSFFGLLPRSKPQLDSFSVSIVAEAAVELCLRYCASR